MQLSSLDAYASKKRRRLSRKGKGKKGKARGKSLRASGKRKSKPLRRFRRKKRIVRGHITRAAVHFLPKGKGRKKNLILPFLTKLLSGGATVWTDEAMIYKSLGKNFSHSSVNHSKREFVSPEGVSSNADESLWAALKGFIRRVGQTSRFSRHLRLQVHLSLFVFNCRCLKKHPLQTFLQLLKAAKFVGHRP